MLLAVLLAVLLAALAWAPACSLGPPAGPPAESAGSTPRPALGDDLHALRQAVEGAPEPGTRIDLLAWRELDVRDGALAPSGSEASPVEARAVLVHRRCRRQLGWTERREVERSSWFLLRKGGLVAFDHAVFDAGCRVQWHVWPTRQEDRPVERALARHLASRHPAGRPGLAERLDHTRARLEVGRGERALDTLAAADREIERLREKLAQGGLGDETRLAHEEELDALRRARARLVAAVRARRSADEDGTAP